MSHTLTIQPVDQLIFISLVIVDYTNGGESVAESEFDPSLHSLAGAIFGTVPAGQNSLGVPLFPLLSGGKVQLFQFVAGSPTQIPTTTALNASIPVLVCIK